MRRPLLLSLVVLGLLALTGAWYVFGAGEATPTVDVAAEAAADVPDDAAEERDGATFVVDQDASTVTFALDEVLRGEDVRVVGSTSQVATTLTLDPADPDGLALGPVLVNARTLATDSGNRDNALRGRILRTDDPANELVEFTPTAIGDVPADTTGAFDVDVTGDLTISGTTREVTFPLAVVPEGDGYRVTGEAPVLRSAFDLQVPSVPFVADVADEVTLAVDLLLVPQEA